MIPFLLFLILLALLFPSLLRAIAVSYRDHLYEGTGLRRRHLAAARLHRHGTAPARRSRRAIRQLCRRGSAAAFECAVMPGTGVHHLDNGTEITIKQTSGNWVYVSGECDDEIGWVFRPLILCGHK
jgi:hypothetical protein